MPAEGTGEPSSLPALVTAQGGGEGMREEVRLPSEDGKQTREERITGLSGGPGRKAIWDRALDISGRGWTHWPAAGAPWQGHGWQSCGVPRWASP